MESDLLEGPKRKVLGRGWPRKKVAFWKVLERGRLRKRVPLKKAQILEGIGTRVALKAGGLEKR